MKSRALIACLLAGTFALSGCQHPTYRPEFENKIAFDYVEKGQLLTIRAQTLYDLVIDEKKNLAVMYSIDGCSGCESQIEPLQAYAQLNHCNIYMIEMSEITPLDYEILVDASTYINIPSNKFPPLEEMLYPYMQFWTQQMIMLSIHDDLIGALRTYTTVAEPIE